MTNIQYNDIYDSKLAQGCITHTHPPFLKDYITLHILLRMVEAKSVFEVGTHIGEGTQIICNAVPEAEVHTLDLGAEEYEKSKQHPNFKGMIVGDIFPNGKYRQHYCDSMTFDYSKYPCEAYFIDGEHDYKHPRHETTEILKQNPKLIVWHDADMIEVFNAINDSFAYNSDYELFRVQGTAIAYAIRL